MPTKKLPARLRRAVEIKERKLQYQRQLNSIERLSIPNTKFDFQTVSPTEGQLVALGGPSGYHSSTESLRKKANTGLHLAHEHPVITRDMHVPLVRKHYGDPKNSARQKKKVAGVGTAVNSQFKPDLELKIKGWNMTGEFSASGGIIDAVATEQQQISMRDHGTNLGAVNHYKNTQLQSIEYSQIQKVAIDNQPQNLVGEQKQDFFDQRKFSKAGSENFHIYSKTQLQQVQHEKATGSSLEVDSTHNRHIHPVNTDINQSKLRNDSSPTMKTPNRENKSFLYAQRKVSENYLNVNNGNSPYASGKVSVDNYQTSNFRAGDNYETERYYENMDDTRKKKQKVNKNQDLRLVGQIHSKSPQFSPKSSISPKNLKANRPRGSQVVFDDQVNDQRKQTYYSSGFNQYESLQEPTSNMQLSKRGILKSTRSRSKQNQQDINAALSEGKVAIAIDRVIQNSTSRKQSDQDSKHEKPSLKIRDNVKRSESKQMRSSDIKSDNNPISPGPQHSKSLHLQRQQEDDINIFNTVKFASIDEAANRNGLPLGQSYHNGFDATKSRYNSKDHSPDRRMPDPNDTAMANRSSKKSVKNWSAKRRRTKTWKTVKPNIQQEMNEKMDKAMRDIIFQYTRTDKDRLESSMEPIDYTGTGFLKKQLKIGPFADRDIKMDFFERGVINAQDLKLHNMRRKLNQSVDVASLQARREERAKKRYIDTQLYNKVSTIMEFDQKKFESNVDKVIKPFTEKNQYVRPLSDYNQDPQPILNQDLNEQQNQRVDSALYDTKLPIVEQFIQRKDLKKSPKPNIDNKTANQLQHLDHEDVSYDSAEFEDSQIQDPEYINYQNQIGPENQPADRTYTNENLKFKSTESASKRMGKGDGSKTLEVSLSNPVLEETDPVANYSVQLNPKIRNQTYAMLEQKIIQDQPSIETKEELRHVEKVFKMIHDFCIDNLNVGPNELEKHIEDILDPYKTVSPLLKYYNDLAKHCNFRLPIKSLLKFDQKYFRSYVGRLRDAQMMEIKQVRNLLVVESRKTLLKSFKEAKELLQEEVKNLLFQYDTLKKKLADTEKENSQLKNRTIRQEEQIVEFRTYLNKMIIKRTYDDQELFFENNGGGTASKNYKYGAVIQNIDEYHRQLVQDCRKKSEELQSQIEQGILKERINEMSHLLQDHVRQEYEKNNIRRESKLSMLSGHESQQSHQSQFQNYLGKQQDKNKLQSMRESKQQLLHTGQSLANVDSQQSVLSLNLQAKHMNMDIQTATPDNIQKCQKFQWQTIVPQKDEIVMKIEPFFKSQFGLYGGSVKLELSDMSDVLQTEMYQHHKVMINQQREQIEELKAERNGLQLVANEYHRDNDRLRKEVEDYRKKLLDLEFNTSNEIRKVRLGAEESINKNKIQCENKIYQIRSYMTAEIEVNHQLVSKLLAENKWKSDKLRKFATMLRIPRLHFEYIDKYGFNEFVDYCEDIVKRERSLQQIKQYDQGRIELRGKHAIQKLHKMKLSHQEQFEQQKLGQIFQSPFKIQGGIQDQRREDHKDHKKQEYQQKNNVTLVSDKSMLDDIEMINFLKQRSLLNLSELIHKHRDKQPQLIAALSPNIKQQLLTDPHFFKNLQTLEQQDPINKKVKEIKEFISAIKSHTFDKHFISQKQENQNIKTKTNQLSRSINAEAYNTQKYSLLNLQDVNTINMNSYRNSQDNTIPSKESQTRSPRSQTQNSVDEIVFQGFDSSTQILDQGLFTFNIQNPVDLKLSGTNSIDQEKVNQSLENSKNSYFGFKKTEQKEQQYSVSNIQLKTGISVPTVGKDLHDSTNVNSKQQFEKNIFNSGEKSGGGPLGLGFNSSIKNISNSLTKQSGMRSIQDKMHMSLNQQSMMNLATKTKTNLHSKAAFNFGLKYKNYQYKSPPGSELKLNQSSVNCFGTKAGLSKEKNKQRYGNDKQLLQTHEDSSLMHLSNQSLKYDTNLNSQNLNINEDSRQRGDSLKVVGMINQSSANQV